MGGAAMGPNYCTCKTAKAEAARRQSIEDRLTRIEEALEALAKKI